MHGQRLRNQGGAGERPDCRQGCVSAQQEEGRSEEGRQEVIRGHEARCCLTGRWRGGAIEAVLAGAALLWRAGAPQSVFDTKRVALQKGSMGGCGSLSVLLTFLAERSSISGGYL